MFACVVSLSSLRCSEVILLKKKNHSPGNILPTINLNIRVFLWGNPFKVVNWKKIYFLNKFFRI